MAWQALVRDGLALVGGSAVVFGAGRYAWLYLRKTRELNKLDREMTTLLREALGDSERVRKLQKENSSETEAMHETARDQLERDLASTRTELQQHRELRRWLATLPERHVKLATTGRDRYVGQAAMLFRELARDEIRSGRATMADFRDAMEHAARGEEPVGLAANRLYHIARLFLNTMEYAGYIHGVTEATSIEFRHLGIIEKEPEFPEPRYDGMARLASLEVED